MSYELDDDILQDFLVEAGEILELLSEQLVELENNPEDRELLNAIFRGFHTVKGGAGFLALTELVETCHGAENVFDILRNGQRSVTSSLMDTMLRALDTVNAQFRAVQDQEPLEPADPALLDELHKLCRPASEDEIDEVEPVIAEVEEEEVIEAPEPEVAQPTVSQAIDSNSIDEITQDEFEKLLDELHGKGTAPNVHSENAAPPPAPKAPSASAATSGDITDDEFEKLLDDLHGVGKAPTVESAPEVAAKSASTSSTPPPKSTAAPKASAGGGDDLMTDEEFEKLLDDLHGSGKGPLPEELEMATRPASENVKPAEPVKPTETAKPKAEAAKPTPAPQPKVTAPAASSPAKAPVAVAEKKEVSAPAAKKAQTQPETTVRVDTSTLDIIMNMIGELVLVRNRLLSLGLNSNDEEMAKAVANLDVVTADLQGAVMKTRMQPIKKVFGRFPRVVRDLARTLKKDIVLETRGEETDLDKNLVEALADPIDSLSA